MEKRSLILRLKDLSRKQWLRKKEIKGRVNRKDHHEGKGKVPILIPSLESNESFSSFTSWSLPLFYHLLLCLSLSFLVSFLTSVQKYLFLFLLSATGSLKQQQKNTRTRNRANRPEKLSHVSYVCNTRPFIEWKTVVGSHVMLVLNESVFDLGRIYKDRKKRDGQLQSLKKKHRDRQLFSSWDKWMARTSLSRLFILLCLQLHLQEQSFSSLLLQFSSLLQTFTPHPFLNSKGKREREKRVRERKKRKLRTRISRMSKKGCKV